MPRRRHACLLLSVAAFAFLFASRVALAADVAVSGYGDTAGYHVLKGVSAAGVVTWREVVVLRPGNVQDQSWTGSVCVSPDGRTAGAVALPASVASDPSRAWRSGVAFRINLDTGRTAPITGGAAVAYDTPSCGPGQMAALRSAGDAEGRGTLVTLVDLASGAAHRMRFASQLTSLTPVHGGLLGARGGRLVRVVGGHVQTLAKVPGTIYDIRAQGTQTVQFLSAAFGGARATLWQLRDGDLTRIESRPRIGAHLLGHRIVTNAAVTGVSSGEEFAVGAGPAPVAFAIPSGRRLAVRSQEHRAAVVTRGGLVARSARSAASSPCAVSRLDPDRQVMQPGSDQIDWAAQQAARGLLTGSNARPSGYANMGLPAYSPNEDFPRIPLAHPAGDGWDTVPRSVIEGVLAQESNWQQASFHALPGIAGGPLISDFYGTGGNAIDHVDYAKSDCGYGIAQVTDGMRAGAMAPDLQTKVAVDYAENIAAGLRILEQKWNQLHAAGIVANDGSPRYLENWYFALWAYNTGVQPGAQFGNTSGCTPGPNCTGSDGTWGLGWLNNPANPAYPPNRGGFLESSYDDARTPSRWPYQERVLGWMLSPLRWGDNERYKPADLRGTSVWLNAPAAEKLCTPQDNRCSGAGPYSSGTCSLASSQCWWHQPVKWIDCARNCASSDYNVARSAPEPAQPSDPHEPQCRPDGLPAGVAAAIIVDDLPAPGLNLVFCRNTTWTTGGTFAYEPGRDGGGEPVGEIDTHQLGAGFGGHFFFSHGEPDGSGALINRATWTPNLPAAQEYDVLAFGPDTGADLEDATYRIDTGGYGDPVSITVNQHHDRNVWLALGRFPLGPGATVSLTNISKMTPGSVDVAFDAVAFVPQGGRVGAPTPPSTSNPAPVPPPAGSVGSEPPPGTARMYTQCDPGADSKPWNVFKVTIKCIGSGQVFLDPVLAPQARCIVKVGIDLLPITRIAKFEKTISAYRWEIKRLRKELKEIDQSFPRRLDVGLQGIGKALDFTENPVQTTLNTLMSSRLALFGLRQGLGHPRKHKELLETLTNLKQLGGTALDILSPYGDFQSCRKEL